MMSNVLASAEKSGIDDGEVVSSGFATGHLGSHGFGIQNMKVSERHAGHFKGPSEFAASYPPKVIISDADAAAGIEFNQQITAGQSASYNHTPRGDNNQISHTKLDKFNMQRHSMKASAIKNISQDSSHEIFEIQKLPPVSYEQHNVIAMHADGLQRLSDWQGNSRTTEQQTVYEKGQIGYLNGRAIQAFTDDAETVAKHAQSKLSSKSSAINVPIHKASVTHQSGASHKRSVSDGSIFGRDGLRSKAYGDHENAQAY